MALVRLVDYCGKDQTVCLCFLHYSFVLIHLCLLISLLTYTRDSISFRHDIRLIASFVCLCWFLDHDQHIFPLAFIPTASNSPWQFTAFHAFFSSHHAFHFLEIVSWLYEWDFLNAYFMLADEGLRSLSVVYMTHRLPSSNCINIQLSSPSIQVFTANIQYSNITSSPVQSYYQTCN